MLQRSAPEDEGVNGIRRAGHRSGKQRHKRQSRSEPLGPKNKTSPIAEKNPDEETISRNFVS